MPAILDGKAVRDQILAELKPRVDGLRAVGHSPGLAVVLAGDNAASEIYVRNKVKACHELGIASETLTPPQSVRTGELLKIVESLNRRHNVDGILVQMPLPPQCDAKQVLLSIDPSKDVDGFHPYNVGNLVAGNPGPRACTPAGIMELLRRNSIDPAGKRAVVVGRSDIVGKPMAILLLHAHATVTICHSKTPDLAAVCREADILVAAIGRAAMIRREHIKPGAVVVDVGMNRLASPEEVQRVFGTDSAKLAEFERKRSLLIGDVHPLELDQASAYTPVPGGVGPLTIAMLMANTVAAAERRAGL
jgi:methylenetetrahydrofolate dehydrogenase (NADP+)/methenyltetrahydrofolate cyclohydrolase